MESIPIWSVWLTLGVALLIGEIFTASFFLFCFGLGAVASALVSCLEFGEGVQWICFLLVSSLSVLLSRFLAEKYAKEPPRKAGVDRFIGQEAVVIERIDSSKGTGRVRVLHEEWRADPEANQVFEVDAKVLVIGVQGVHLIVSEKIGEVQ